MSRISAEAIVRSALSRTKRSEATFERFGLDRALLSEMERGVSFYLPDVGKREECFARLLHMLPPQSRALEHPRDAERPRNESAPRPAKAVPSTIEVRVVDENGIVDARTRARVLATEIGFRATDQYKIGTAVSELSRNIYNYAGTGTVSMGAVTSPRKGIFIIAKDAGPGIPDLPRVLSETYESKTGLGRGLQGCKKLMDEFAVDTAPGQGTTVTLRKYL
jgi:serine/threonine-protein kinase RsbT